MCVCLFAKAGGCLSILICVIIYRVCVCVCVCVFACVFACVCVCVCVLFTKLFTRFYNGNSLTQVIKEQVNPLAPTLPLSPPHTLGAYP